jgi:hypothetical protein
MIISAVATGNDSALAAASALGRSEGERFDSDLRALELAERERFLLERGDTAGAAGVDALSNSTVTLARLRREEAELATFHAAVVQSLSWRLAEALRSMFGRSWSSPPIRGASVVPPVAVAERVALEQRVRELADFRSAVQESRTWRVLQRLRRLAGREW